MLGLVVQEDADEDDRRAEAGQEGDRVAKYDDGQPDEQDSLGGVGNAGNGKFNQGGCRSTEEAFLETADIVVFT